MRQSPRSCAASPSCKATWNAKRHDLVAAARERKVIEHLRERRRRAFEAEEARQEELELDESNARCRERAARDRPQDCRTQRTTA